MGYLGISPKNKTKFWDILGYPTKQKQQGQIFGISQDIPKNNNKSWDILFFLQVILVCQKKLGISRDIQTSRISLQISAHFGITRLNPTYTILIPRVRIFLRDFSKKNPYPWDKYSISRVKSSYPKICWNLQGYPRCQDIPGYLLNEKDIPVQIGPWLG